MSSRDFDPLRLDVGAFAKAGGELEGRWLLSDLGRLAGACAGELTAIAGNAVRWHLRGERRDLSGGESQVWLHLRAGAGLPLECQRCLEPVDANIEIERSFLFVHGEEAAAQLDADSEDDVLAMTRALDLRELIEDELLLALPLVPRHAACPTPLQARHDDEVVEAPAHPFSALAALKRDGPLN